jgi:hypothetical protein
MKHILIILILLIGLFAKAQRLDGLQNKKPIEVTGGINFNSIGYNAIGIDNRRNPFDFYASGSLNLSIYGWSIPLNFSYSNREFGYSQPFNQLSLHPSYKWLTAHIGYVSMSFSPYTLNGHTFYGIGLDAEPNDWLKISTMYGRLQKEIMPNSDIEIEVLPVYKRLGAGAKIQVGTNSRYIKTIVFKAWDDKNSLPALPDSLGVVPQDNLVLGIEAGASFFNRFRLQVEYAASALTMNGFSQDYSPENVNVFGYMGSLFPYKSSTTVNNAFKSSLNYRANSFVIGFGYERVDPLYRTLGAYYFNNDLENITANISTSLFKNKVNVSVNGGLQHDNLDNNKLNDMNRWVGAMSINYRPNNKLNINGNYSNFQSYTYIRSQFDDINSLSPYENLDTLNFTQISQTISLAASYQLGSSKEKRQTISVNTSMQTASDKQYNNNSNTSFYNANAMWNMNLTKHNLSFSTGINWMQNQMNIGNSMTVGPTIGIRKSFLNKTLRTGFSTSYNQSRIDGITNGEVINIRLNTNYTIKKRHRLNASLITVTRTGEINNSTEFTLNIGYSVSFDVFKINTLKKDSNRLKEETTEKDNIASNNNTK